MQPPAAAPGLIAIMPRTASSVGVIAACLFFCAAPVHAQEGEGDGSVPQPRPSVLKQLFPHPTGQNGFEEVALAIDALRDAKAPYPPEREFTLEKKRAYLADPACQKALFYLRAGLAKKVVHYPVPEPTMEALNDVAVFMPFAGVRALARLLAVEQYALLADGKTREAVVSTEYALRLAQAIKGGTLTSSLVAGAVRSIALEQLARHREQWSLRDCERILEVVRTYHALPDPALQTIEWERRLAIHFASVIRQDAAAFSAVMTDTGEEEGEDDPELKPYAAEIERLRSSPEARAAFASQVSSHMNAAYDRMAMGLRDPTTLGQEEKASGGGPSTLAALFADSLTAGASDTLIVNLVTDRVRLQLLGVHAAIRKYRWENGRLPERLEDLHLTGSLATDPFSGRPFAYKKTGDAEYELSSMGGPGADDGKRTPITLPRTPTPAAP